MASTEGRAFNGLMGGAHYNRWARVMGMGPEFYRKALGGVQLGARMRALDLGCGTGSLSLALAAQSHPDARVCGIDISDDQLTQARRDASTSPCKVEFEHASMAGLPFPERHFDVVMTCMALHETPPGVRRSAIAEAARVLKNDGIFLLVDWGKPRLGGWGLLWLPLVLPFAINRDNWHNAYAQLCRERGLEREENGYVNSIARRQAFRKAAASP